MTKVDKKGRAKDKVDEIIRRLTGCSQEELEKHPEEKSDFETLFTEAPKLDPARRQITGVLCGVRVEEIKEP